MSTTTALVQVKSLCFAWPLGGSWHSVLGDLSCSFPSSSITTILGPSGCGKTTLLNLIAGLLKPTSGEIRYFDGSTDPKGSVGYVFQDPYLIPWRNVLDNAVLGAEIRGHDLSEAGKRAGQLLQSYGLGEHQSAYPTTLSGGMRQRVAIVRAAVSGAKLLLLDEPFSNSDFFLQRELQRDLSRLVDHEGFTAIMVTHDIAEAVNIGDRVIVLTKRPAKVQATIDIPIPRSERLTDRPGVQQKLAPYFEQVWLALQETNHSTNDKEPRQV